MGVSHVAVVSADLNGFVAFQEKTIGLEREAARTPTDKGSEP